MPSHVVATVVTGCRQALGDYQAGLTDDVELRQALCRAGIAIEPDHVWLFDLSLGRWWAFDGIAVEPVARTSEPARATRLRQIVDDLARGDSPEA